MSRIPGNIFVCLSLVLLPVFSYNSHASDSAQIVPGSPLDKEIYDVELYQQIQSLKDLISYIDKNFTGERNSNEFVNYIGVTISRRFYHGYSYYSSNDNWIAGLTGRLVWDDLSAIVLPDDILKHPNAACSQQAIVLMACAKHYGFDYRRVSFNHHFATEIKVRDKWHYVDPNVEVIPNEGSVSDLMKNGTLYAIYESKIENTDMTEFLGIPRYGQMNEYPAKKTAWFQMSSRFLSNYLILFIFCAELLLFLKYQQKDNTLLKS